MVLVRPQGPRFPGLPWNPLGKPTILKKGLVFIPRAGMAPVAGRAPRGRVATRPVEDAARMGHAAVTALLLHAGARPSVRVRAAGSMHLFVTSLLDG